MKGIIIAGGSGTRLEPLTRVISKPLLPVYDKPMVYYPLSVLMLAGIKDILIIAKPNDLPRFIHLLGDGSQLGIRLTYEAEPAPRGIAQAFIIGKEFIGDSDVTLILGDNIFYGQELASMLETALKHHRGATVFGYYVQDPTQFGVVAVDETGKALSIEEKPENPKSNYAVTGLYIFDNDVVEIAQKQVPSARGELEITDVNRAFLQRDQLKVILLGKGFAWMDTGTHQSLAEATYFIEAVEKMQNEKIGCIEEIAFKKQYISKEQLLSLAAPLLKTDYGKYLLQIANLK